MCQSPDSTPMYVYEMDRKCHYFHVTHVFVFWFLYVLLFLKIFVSFSFKKVYIIIVSRKEQVDNIQKILGLYKDNHNKHYKYPRNGWKKHVSYFSVIL